MKELNTKELKNLNAGMGGMETEIPGLEALGPYAVVGVEGKNEMIFDAEKQEPGGKNRA